DQYYAYASSSESDELPIIINDPDLEVQLVTDGLEFPTGMAFLGSEDILVTEKDTGEVKRIINGELLEEPLLDVKVANEAERGLLGIAVSKKHNLANIPSGSVTNDVANVFLFFTESSDEEDGSDNCDRVNYCSSNGNPLGHRIYKYNFEGEKLANRQLLLDIPPNRGADHLGGNLLVGPDNNVYLVTGDGDSCEYDSCEEGVYHSSVYAQTANFDKGDPPQGRGGIIRITQDGNIVSDGNGKGILGEDHPLDMYYAYGIRNSFGMDFDPVTGNLWDTENGPGFGDELNLVRPGFNSGWARVQGVWPISDYDLLDPTPQMDGYFDDAASIFEMPEGLVDFNNKGEYSNPEFTWNIPVGVTAVKFLSSDKLGKQFENDLFVGDIKNGNLYLFDLTEDRTTLSLAEELADNVADDEEELEEVLFAEGFGGVTDIEVGPDGYLYVLSANGSLYKIIGRS
ncbi:MAG: PQQ-dependent sugar dehydrogenase, partial [Thermoproteota archaeon]|nr:PQQ-dependent sugar dehydrogenase [Thermoproteota archaeon]